MDNGNPEFSAEHLIQKNMESRYQESTMLNKISWILQPLFSYQKATKPLNRVPGYFLSVIENIVFQGMILSNESKEYVTSREDSVTFLHSITESLYRLWFVVYMILRSTVNYIESVYEEVVPLIPGNIPSVADVDKENMTIRKLCFYSVVHMILRLTFHVKKYFQNVLFETCKIRLEDF